MSEIIQKLENCLTFTNRLILDEKKVNDFLKIEQENIKKLYLMYEFSDKVRLLDKSSQYGSLWNYVDVGILTEDEARKVILM